VGKRRPRLGSTARTGGTPLADLIVLGFENEDTAEAVRTLSAKLMKEHLIELNDAVVVVRTSLNYANEAELVRALAGHLEESPTPTASASGASST
jgi:uncharacterized membrane protein